MRLADGALSAGGLRGAPQQLGAGAGPEGTCAGKPWGTLQVTAGRTSQAFGEFGEPKAPSLASFLACLSVPVAGEPAWERLQTE